MKRVLALILVLLTLAGCVAVPVYDRDYPYYYGAPYPYYYGRPYPYGYWGPEVNLFFAPGFHGHGFHGGGGHVGGRR